MALWTMLWGCSAIEDAKDAVEGATDTTVVQASILGVQEPTDPNVATLIAATSFAPGTTATVFLADASNPDEMEDSPITGASVSVEAVSLTEGEPGLYTAAPDTGPPYDAGVSWSLSIDDGASHSASLVLPAPAADVFGTDAVVSHALGSPLSVPLGGLGFASSIVVVIGPSGTPTFSNNPETITELYEATKSEDVGTIEIPGDAFSEAGLHAVGVAGMEHSVADGLTDLNTILSKVRAGEMVFTPVDVN
jgi:hypothetical protein